jgi:hypothetical protein
MISLWKVRIDDFIIFLSAINVCKCTKVCLRVWWECLAHWLKLSQYPMVIWEQIKSDHSVFLAPTKLRGRKNREKPIIQIYNLIIEWSSPCCIISVPSSTVPPVWLTRSMSRTYDQYSSPLIDIRYCGVPYIHTYIHTYIYIYIYIYIYPTT